MNKPLVWCLHLGWFLFSFVLIGQVSVPGAGDTDPPPPYWQNHGPRTRAYYFTGNFLVRVKNLEGSQWHPNRACENVTVGEITGNGQIVTMASYTNRATGGNMTLDGTALVQPRMKISVPPGRWQMTAYRYDPLTGKIWERTYINTFR